MSRRWGVAARVRPAPASTRTEVILATAIAGMAGVMLGALVALRMVEQIPEPVPGLFWYENPGPTSFRHEGWARAPVPRDGVILHDVDLDGDLDVLRAEQCMDPHDPVCR